MSIADQLESWCVGLIAWNMPSYFVFRTKRRSSNQHGRTYTFDDGSRAYVAKGGAFVRVLRD